MASEHISIQHVSDTALWVAHYRAIESEQPAPLFHDPLAKVLVGDRGRKIAQSMRATSRYTQWSVVIRTCVIDSFIQRLVSEGVDMVVNLGAGLDTRPYRLKLPKTLRWIEVDYPRLIEGKEKLLSAEQPQVQLERVRLDLADRVERQKLFARINSQSSKVLILTEGVIPYLTEEQVASLAEDLHAQPNIHYWIAEYFAPAVYKYLQTKGRLKRMKNAPFVFFPKNWFEFFKQSGWEPGEIRYLSEESAKLHRAQPMPWWAHLFVPFMSKETIKKYQQQMGYVLYSKV
jgi:methyltransferase (TIGR00027 family)